MGLDLRRYRSFAYKKVVLLNDQWTAFDPEFRFSHLLIVNAGAGGIQFGINAQDPARGGELNSGENLTFDDCDGNKVFIKGTAGTTIRVWVWKGRL